MKSKQERRSAAASLQGRASQADAGKHASLGGKTGVRTRLVSGEGGEDVCSASKATLLFSIHRLKVPFSTPLNPDLLQQMRFPIRKKSQELRKFEQQDGRISGTGVGGQRDEFKGA